MAYVDTLTITVQSGNGGDGCISFRREKYVPKGGPDGGDGGHGGHVFIRASKKISTFLDLSEKKHYKGTHGAPGRPRKQSGKKGQDCILNVPCGTLIYNEHHELIHDLTEDNQEVRIATGGKGGKGNPHFCTSRVQTPKKATPGKPGESFILHLELNVIADVGFVGYPNAGKSTLLHTLTQATPKIDNYPFTTLHPNLGILRKYNQELILADIPGIIEGASEGVGLGIDFLRHISRTHTLLFVLDGSEENLESFQSTFEQLVHEINNYSPTMLNEKKYIVVLNKIDLIPPLTIKKICDIFESLKIELLCISCFTRHGIEALEQRIFTDVNQTIRN